MELNEFWALQENWKAFFEQYDLHRAVYEVFDIWYDLVNQDNEADVVSHLARLEAANFQMISKYNELPENGRREFLAVSIGPTELPVFETIRNFILNVSHWVNIDGTTRKEIFDKLNEVGFPCKPLEVDALKRAFLKAGKPIAEQAIANRQVAPENNSNLNLITIPKQLLRKLTEITDQGMTKRYKNGDKWGYFNITETTVDISESAYLALKKAKDLRT